MCNPDVLASIGSLFPCPGAASAYAALSGPGAILFFVVVVFMYLIEVSLTHIVMSVSGVWQSHRSLSSVRRECSQDLEDGFPEGVE